MKIDTKKIKGLLEKELATLEAELKTVGHKNPNNPKDWESQATDTDVNASDTADIADNIENYESNTAVLKQLETQYNDVKNAIEKIKNGTYGICEVGNEPIEAERIDASPSARTCIKHKDTKFD